MVYFVGIRLYLNLTSNSYKNSPDSWRKFGYFRKTVYRHLRTHTQTHTHRDRHRHRHTHTQCQARTKQSSAWGRKSAQTIPLLGHFSKLWHKNVHELISKKCNFIISTMVNRRRHNKDSSIKLKGVMSKLNGMRVTRCHQVFVVNHQEVTLMLKSRPKVTFLASDHFWRLKFLPTSCFLFYPSYWRVTELKPTKNYRPTIFEDDLIWNSSRRN